MRGPSALSLGLLAAMLVAASALPQSSAYRGWRRPQRRVATHCRACAEFGLHRVIEAENRRLEERIGALAEQFRAAHGLPDTSATSLLQLRELLTVRAAPGPAPAPRCHEWHCAARFPRRWGRRTRCDAV